VITVGNERLAPPRPTALPSVRRGLPTFPKAGRKDASLPARPYPTPRFPAGAPTQGAHAVPPVPQVSAAGDQRASALAFLRSGPSKDRDATSKLMLGRLTGGGRPQGPAVQGYLNQLVRTLLEGY